MSTPWWVTKNPPGKSEEEQAGQVLPCVPAEHFVRSFFKVPQKVVNVEVDKKDG